MSVFNNITKLLIFGLIIMAIMYIMKKQNKQKCNNKNANNISMDNYIKKKVKKDNKYKIVGNDVDNNSGILNGFNYNADNRKEISPDDYERVTEVCPYSNTFEKEFGNEGFDDNNMEFNQVSEREFIDNFFSFNDKINQSSNVYDPIDMMNIYDPMNMEANNMEIGDIYDALTKSNFK